MFASPSRGIDWQQVVEQRQVEQPFEDEWEDGEEILEDGDEQIPEDEVEAER